MKTLKIVAFYLIFFTFSNAAHARSNDLRLRDGYGLVVFVVDDRASEVSRSLVPKEDLAVASSINPNSEFYITIGPINRTTREVTYNSWSGNPFTTIHTDIKSGKRLLIAQVKAGDYAVYSQTDQKNWTNCFDKGTISFNVVAGTINYIGDYNPFPSSFRIHKAVLTQQMANTTRAGTQQEILGDTLVGFKPAVEVEGGRETVELLLPGVSRIFAKPFTLTLPDVTRTDLVIGGKSVLNYKCPI